MIYEITRIGLESSETQVKSHLDPIECTQCPEFSKTHLVSHGGTTTTISAATTANITFDVVVEQIAKVSYPGCEISGSCRMVDMSVQLFEVEDGSSS